MTGVMAVPRIAKHFCKMLRTLARKQGGGIRDRMGFIGGARSATVASCLSCNDVSRSVPPITSFLSAAHEHANVPSEEGYNCLTSHEISVMKLVCLFS